MSRVEKPAPKPFGNLFGRLKTLTDRGLDNAVDAQLVAPDALKKTLGPGDRLPLQEAVQLAVQIEFSTIPVYLAALYSISQPSSRAYQLLRSVVIEEMFHMNQAANLLVAIGGLPRFTGTAVPQYPGYMPHANPATTPYLGLYRASPQVFAEVFAAIERPAPPHAPPEGDSYSTIAQVYEAILQGLEQYYGPNLFAPNPEGRQRTDIYLGKFGGTPVEVTNLEQAKLAIHEIVAQGEGVVPEGQSYIPAQRFGVYNHYDVRTDGTYGPIVGTPYEMSHFKKFRTVALDVASFPATYPVVSNPRLEDFENPSAAQHGKTFEVAYSLMLDALEATFRRVNGPDPFFTLALPLMHQVLPRLARTLVTTPIRTDGDGSVGPNAAPTFGYRAGCKLSDLDGEIRKSIGKVDDASITSEARFAALASLDEALTCVKQLDASSR